MKRAEFEVVTTGHTRATELIFERLRSLPSELARYPSGAVFIPTDVPDFKAMFLSRLREGRPIVLVFPEGEERIVPPTHGPRRGIGARARALRTRLLSLR